MTEHETDAAFVERINGMRPTRFHYEGGGHQSVSIRTADLLRLTALAVPHPIMSPDDVVLEAMRVFACEVGASTPEKFSSRVRERWERGMRAVIAFLSPLASTPPVAGSKGGK